MFGAHTGNEPVPERSGENDLMYLSRLVLNPKSSEVRRDLRDCHELHRTLLRGFPDGIPGDTPRKTVGLLHRVEPARDTDTVVVLVQTRDRPDWSRLPDGYAVDSSSRGQKWSLVRTGAVLPFRLRANVTKKVDTKTGADGQRRHGKRVPLRGDATLLDWLAKRASRSGFELAPSAFDAGFPDVRVIPERDVLGKRGLLVFGSALFEGRLRVVDLAAFKSTIADGVGPGKAFGFGLLSVPT
jgi:CRISPR system Cascade subunit CasE